MRWVVVGLCLGLFVWTLTRTDLRAGWERIRAIGPVVLLVLLPYPVVLGCDALAWRRLGGALGERLRVRDVFRVRLSTEAVSMSTPGGVIWAEGLAPLLIARRSGARIANVVAASTARRWLILRMHCVYIVGTVAFGFTALSRASRHLVGSDALVFAVVIAAIVVALVSLLIEKVTARGRVAGRISRSLGGTRFRVIRTWIELRRHHFTEADEGITKLAADKPAQRRASVALLGLWLSEGLETFLILRLLGADLGLAAVMSFDAALSVVRSAAVFAPAGIGVQDLGYLVVLDAYGVPAASGIAPAFLVVKRLKEVFWIVVGLILLGIKKKEPPPPASTARVAPDEARRREGASPNLPPHAGARVVASAPSSAREESPSEGILECEFVPSQFACSPCASPLLPPAAPEWTATTAPPARTAPPAQTSPSTDRTRA